MELYVSFILYSFWLIRIVMDISPLFFSQFLFLTLYLRVVKTISDIKVRKFLINRDAQIPASPTYFWIHTYAAYTRRRGHSRSRDRGPRNMPMRAYRSYVRCPHACLDRQRNRPELHAAKVAPSSAYISSRICRAMSRSRRLHKRVINPRDPPLLLFVLMANQEYPDTLASFAAFYLAASKGVTRE